MLFFFLSRPEPGGLARQESGRGRKEKNFVAEAGSGGDFAEEKNGVQTPRRAGDVKALGAISLARWYAAA